MGSHARPFLQRGIVRRKFVFCPQIFLVCVCLCVCVFFVFLSSLADIIAA